MLQAFNALGLAVRLAIGAAVVGVIALAGWYVFLRPQQAAQQAATAKTETIAAKAETGAAKDTLRIVVDRQAAEVRIIRTTEENTNAIMAAPGANAPLDPALHAAGIRALCVRDGASDVQCRELVLHGDGDGERAR